MADNIADCIVVGGGVMGLSVARAVAKTGRSCTLLERKSIANSEGSSHGASRINRISYPQRHYMQMAIAARKQWAELEEESGRPLHVRTGSVFAGKPSTYLQDMIDNYREEGHPHQLLSANDANKMFPIFSFPPDFIALYDPSTEITHAATAITALTESCVRHGATVVEQCEVKEVKMEKRDGVGEVVRVTSNDGRAYFGRKVVFACGGWTPIILRNYFGFHVGMEALKTYFAYFKIEKNYHKMTAGSPPIPAYVEIDENVIHYNLPPVEKEDYIKTGVHGGPAIQCDRDGREMDEAARASTCKFIAERYRGVKAEAEEEHSCIYSMTKDEEFLLDFLPRSGRLIAFVGGCSGHGFKHAPEVGKIVKDALFLDVPFPPFSRFDHIIQHDEGRSFFPL
mmetsp:Transcript_50066/g.128874  ORF Transcript_50066/g.128874 Transcript_50066/m.128874 type:complete len:397 (-) Transcript_50066:50-1240(-)